MIVVYYVDGACSGNGTANAKGGFGVIQVDISSNKILYAYQDFSIGTTNNREELKAIIHALKHYYSNFTIEVDDSFLVPVIYSDSAYAINTFTNWMYSWAKNSWIKSDKKVPENLDLIQEFYELQNKGYKVDLRKVKGHSKDKWNSIADALATGRITSIKFDDEIKLI